MPGLGGRGSEEGARGGWERGRKEDWVVVDCSAILRKFCKSDKKSLCSWRSPVSPGNGPASLPPSLMNWEQPLGSVVLAQLLG